MSDQLREQYQAEVRRLAAEHRALHPAPRRSMRERIAQLLGKHVAQPVPVVPKRAAGGERCSGCGEAMIAGSGPLHRPLLCGPCRSHGMGNPMEPVRPYGDEPTSAA